METNPTQESIPLGRTRVWLLFVRIQFKFSNLEPLDRRGLGSEALCLHHFLGKKELELEHSRLFHKTLAWIPEGKRKQQIFS